MKVRELEPREELEVAKDILKFLEDKYLSEGIMIRKTKVLELATIAAESYYGNYINAEDPTDS